MKEIKSSVNLSTKIGFFLHSPANNLGLFYGKKSLFVGGITKKEIISDTDGDGNDLVHGIRQEKAFWSLISRTLCSHRQYH
jgi:hypothetical protein